MALSGLHPNKTVVPWFNTDEWKLVKTLIFSDSSTTADKQQAVGILKNWKRRTPTLICGVEGTLIVLNALLVNNSDPEKSNIIQGQAIMRFLNVCVAGRSRQGSLHRTVRQIGLPVWLINLRHDVAHGSVMPSNEMLHLGLNECLKCVKANYWDKQEVHLTKERSYKSLFEEVKLLVKLYCEINLMRYFNEKLNCMSDIFESKPSIRDMCSRFKKMLKEKFDIQGCLSSILPKISKYFVKLDSSHLNDLICDTIIAEEALFEVKLTESEGKQSIPDDFIRIWKELINWLGYNNLLLLFIRKLIHFANNPSSNKRIFGNLWLKIFFSSIYLNSHSSVNKIDDKLVINLNFNYDNLTKNICELEEDVLANPNKETLSFLKIFLLLCGHDEEYVNNKLLVVKAYTTPQCSGTENKIYTLDDFRPVLEDQGIDLNNLMQLDDSSTKVTEKLNGSVEIKPKVRIATDPSVFVGYPIGILSFQVPV